MTIDRTALASDLEQLGLKAIAGQVSSCRIPTDRALRAVERLADRAAMHDDRAKVDRAHLVLNRYRSEEA
jgi:hypothetical protein